MKYLIAGLGNPGDEYENTRHNIGFRILDALAQEHKLIFEPARLADKTLLKHKGKQFHLIKPSTFMNRSGKAVRYWMNELKIPIENLLVVVDEKDLPFGKLRMRAKSADGGHNGLSDISEQLGTISYARLRFGIGSDFPTGSQVQYVLSQWETEETVALENYIKNAMEAIISYGSIGLVRTMNQFN